MGLANPLHCIAHIGVDVERAGFSPSSKNSWHAASPSVLTRCAPTSPSSHHPRGLTNQRRFRRVYRGSASGERKDARDAFVIAEAARAPPATLRLISVDDDEIADLKMLAEFDDDLAVEATRLTNRIRGVLVDVHPAFERAIGPYLDKTVGPAILARFGGPVGLSTAGKRSLHTLVTKHAPRSHKRIVERIADALGEQTVLIPGSRVADQVLKHPAAELLSTMEARKELEAQFE
ncbi:IS110 family transposase [Rhodococcus sp. WB9]|nr:IS110 family transposase [Rhodococcus sp. WB9]